MQHLIKRHSLNFSILQFVFVGAFATLLFLSSCKSDEKEEDSKQSTSKNKKGKKGDDTPSLDDLFGGSGGSGGQGSIDDLLGGQSMDDLLGGKSMDDLMGGKSMEELAAMMESMQNGGNPLGDPNNPYKDLEYDEWKKQMMEAEKQSEELQKKADEGNMDIAAMMEIQKKLMELTFANPAHSKRLNDEKYGKNMAVITKQMAKDTFKHFNPGLYQEEGSNDRLYKDRERGNYVYLPLGDRSFADEVVSFTPGRLFDKAKRQVKDPKSTVGKPDMSGARNVLSLGLTGSLTLRLKDNVLIDVNGPDLFVFEVFRRIEPTMLEISKDGTDFIKVGEIGGGFATVDINKYVSKDDVFHYIRLTDLDTEGGATPGADIDAVATIGGAILLNLDASVLFDYGKSELKEEAIEALNELSKSIDSFQKADVRIIGHTDSDGGDAYNKGLSQKRAKSVSSHLQKQIGTRKFKWTSKGMGESSPVVPNDNDENKALNRRVEILIIPKS